jgi:dihydroxyacetone kinase
MLAAAVSGDIFASPSVDAVLAGILAATGEAGCLLVVKNYTGDRLNFGLAAERARALGLDVEMVIVADDIAIEGAPRPRGIAGTLFVHKVAGHLARAGAPLSEVKAAAERVARAVVSIGVSLTTCNIPGQAAPPRIGPEEIELGLGIHGEPGAAVVPVAPIRELAKTMTTKLEQALDGRGAPRAPLALLINDLGGVPPIEMALVTRAVLSAMTREVGLIVGPDRLMTSLDMKGFSISALPLDPELERALSSTVAPRAWPPPRRVTTMTALPLPAPLAPRRWVPSSHAARRAALERICATVVRMAPELDALDARVGDGDTGTTLATAARALVSELDRLPFADPPSLCQAISEELSRVMGGSSGILLAIFVAAVGAKVGDPPCWALALREGLVRLQDYGGARLGDRTMLDALGPAIAAFEAGGMDDAARAARAGADATASLAKAHAGRASYVPAERLRGVPDPGAVVVAAVFEALAGS